MPTRQNNYAVVDLGSNSFHMVIAQENGEIRIIDKLREPVRLADGLDADGRLSEEAQERALACLERFAQRIRSLPEPHVRVIATNTLRRARKTRAFRERIARLLGHPVEIVSGDEEARLIYQGVAHSRSDPGRKRLVVDIGGGSTELVVGQDFEVLRAHSLFLGCVGLSQRYFRNGKLKSEQLEKAETAAFLEVRSVQRRLLETGFELAIGSSGTVNAIAEILAANGWSDGRIDMQGLQKLRKALIKAGSVAQLNLPGLREDRKPVIAGGLCILRAVFHELELSLMEASSGALREGVLYELIGREHESDIRHATIGRLAQRFSVDQGQAQRVGRVSRELGEQLGFVAGAEFDPYRFLRWASELHEIGHALSYTGHHRHGAYIVRNSHLPGFGRDDQLLLSALLHNQRRRIHSELWSELSGAHAEFAPLMTICLRLAILLNRSRSLTSTPLCRLDATRRRIELHFAPNWFEQHRLTEADLVEEARFLAAIGFQFSYSDEPLER